MSAARRVALALVAAVLLGAVSCALPGNEPPTPGSRLDEPAPVSAEEAVWADEVFRDERPAPGPVKELTPPRISPYALRNGASVYAVGPGPLPTISLSLSFDVGAVSDPPDRAGLTDLCLDLLDEGTRRSERAAFRERQADAAVRVWSNGGADTSSVGLSCLEEHFDEAFALMAEMLREPGLRRADFERLRAERKADLAQTRGSASAISRRVFPALLWGPEHPRGRRVTEASLDAMSPHDCRAIARRLAPVGARLYVAGAPDREALERSFQRHLGGWSGTAPAQRLVEPPSPRRGAIYLVDVPGAAQSVISVGVPGPAMGAPDHAATHVMARILGGSFSSRINMNLREDKGYAYGGRGRFVYGRGGGYFHAGASVRTDATGAALVELARELDGIRARPATAEELQREREGALLALPARFATSSDTLRAIQRLVFHGLPLDWYETHQRALARVDAAAVKTAAHEHIPETGYVILVVGDASAIEPELAALAAEGFLGADKVVSIDADGWTPAEAKRAAAEARRAAQRRAEARAAQAAARRAARAGARTDPDDASAPEAPAEPAPAAPP